MTNPRDILERPGSTVTIADGQQRIIIDSALPGRPALAPSTVVDVGPGGHGEYFLLMADARGAKKALDIRLADGATARVWGLFFGREREHYVIDVRTTHFGKNTEAFTKIRGVLTDSALASFTGMIDIAKTGNGTNAYLEEHVLLLGKEAKSLAEPSLEILAPDVKASHAATTGRIDDDQLLYVMSRGIPEGQAKRMIVEGFLRDILDFVPSDLLRAAFQGIMARALDVAGLSSSPHSYG